jgi:hypothetical protein
MPTKAEAELFELMRTGRCWPRSSQRRSATSRDISLAPSTLNSGGTRVSLILARRAGSRARPRATCQRRRDLR